MLAAAGERDLWVMGGAPVASPLAAAGLLDELHVTVVPVVLGAGKPLFETPIERPMRLLGTRTFSHWNGRAPLLPDPLTRRYDWPPRRSSSVG